MNYLRRYPAYVAWRTGQDVPSSSDDSVSALSNGPADTPEEALEKAVRHPREALETEVLDRVREAPNPCWNNSSKIMPSRRC